VKKDRVEEIDLTKYEELDRILRKTTPMHEILLHFKQRQGNVKLARKRLRKPKKILVTVDIEKEGGNAFTQANSATFSEIREVEIDSRMRTLKFCEDLRPAYFGTFSKRSLVLSGRKPFHKDSSLFNYDVDSELEWSEEEEGEDIEMSDGDGM
jgi:chromatin assembly factor 1 subunit A